MTSRIYIISTSLPPDTDVVTGTNQCVPNQTFENRTRRDLAGWDRGMGWGDDGTGWGDGIGQDVTGWDGVERESQILLL
jgi:hypothetical protein